MLVTFTDSNGTDFFIQVGHKIGNRKSGPQRQRFIHYLNSKRDSRAVGWASVQRDYGKVDGGDHQRKPFPVILFAFPTKTGISLG